MCRLQHSLGIMWRPRAPPLTAPTSNGSAQPCRPGPGAGGPSSHAGRSGRCQSVACSRGAHAGLYGGLPRRPAGGGAESSRGGGPGAWLPGAGGPPSSPRPPVSPGRARPTRAPRPDAEERGARAPHREGRGRACRDAALGASVASRARAAAPRAERQPPGRSGAARAARARGACALVTGTRAAGARS